MSVLKEEMLSSYISPTYYFGEKFNCEGKAVGMCVFNRDRSFECGILKTDAVTRSLVQILACGLNHNEISWDRAVDVLRLWELKGRQS